MESTVVERSTLSQQGYSVVSSCGEGREKRNDEKVRSDLRLKSFGSYVLKKTTLGSRSTEGSPLEYPAVTKFVAG